MTKKKQSEQQSIQLILDILSFESSSVILKQQLDTIAVDWDTIVVVASKHLVLPAVYCRLEQKSLLDHVPDDLKLYLQELTQLNRDRNQTLLNEAEHISKLFKTTNINHVFIKGVALLAGNYFKDLGERMIGDIDLLVASEDLDKAFNLLVKEGYSNFLPFNYEVKNYRHRPRQISKKHLGAIELHDQLLKHDYNQLIDKNFLLVNKEIINGVAIPKPEELIWNTILAQQINDRCYYYNVINLKGIYDTMVVGLAQKPILIKKLSKQKYSHGFLNLASVFYPEIAPTTETLSSRLHQHTFLFNLNLPKYGSLLIKLKAILLGIKQRLGLFIFNKSYREHVLKNKIIK